MKLNKTAKDALYSIASQLDLGYRDLDLHEKASPSNVLLRVLKALTEEGDYDVEELEDLDSGDFGTSSEEEEDDEDDDQEEPARKRKRTDSSEDSEEQEEDGEGDDDGGADEQESSEEEDEGSEEEEEGEDEEQLDDLFTKPVIVEDPRSSEDVPHYSTIHDAEELMQWLVGPIELGSFLDAVLEQQPAFISRPNNRDCYSGLLSRKEIDRLLRRKPGLKYSYNVDVTHYSRKGVRENFNYNGDEEPEDEEDKEIADADVVWRRVDEDGCSMRLLHPQRFCDSIWELLSKLEDFWKGCLGSNSYLTPAGAQGFAPHFDDIDAFVLQLEGSKRWKVYAPTDPRNVLPRYSSIDFTEEDLGECVLDVVLHPGDLLYMPRGQIHQAQSLPDSHSLHLTISANQQRTWQGLLESLLPRALELAASKNRALRASVPREVTMLFGTGPVSAEQDEEREYARASINNYAQACLAGIMKNVDLDWGADQLDTEFLTHRLPPVPEHLRVDANGASGSGSHSKAKVKKLKASSRVKLVHPGSFRLMIEADEGEPMALVAHCMANKRDQHAETEEESGEKEEKQGGDEALVIPDVLEFPLGCAETLAELLATDEEPVKISEVSEPEDGAGVTALEVAEALRKAGLIKVV